jgi:hypothetical protein
MESVEESVKNKASRINHLPMASMQSVQHAKPSAVFDKYFNNFNNSANLENGVTLAFRVWLKLKYLMKKT